jgi:hypothetical protein
MINKNIILIFITIIIILIIINKNNQKEYFSEIIATQTTPNSTTAAQTTPIILQELSTITGGTATCITSDNTGTIYIGMPSSLLKIQNGILQTDTSFASLYLLANITQRPSSTITSINTNSDGSCVIIQTDNKYYISTNYGSWRYGGLCRTENTCITVDKYGTSTNTKIFIVNYTNIITSINSHTTFFPDSTRFYLNNCKGCTFIGNTYFLYAFAINKIYKNRIFDNGRGLATAWSGVNVAITKDFIFTIDNVLTNDTGSIIIAYALNSSLISLSINSGTSWTDISLSFTLYQHIRSNINGKLFTSDGITNYVSSFSTLSTLRIFSTNIIQSIIAYLSTIASDESIIINNNNKR